MTVSTNVSRWPSRNVRSPGRPTNSGPVGNAPLASTGPPASLVVRNLPIPSKFSSAKPRGSICEWHVAHTGFFRCCSSRSRTDAGFPPSPRSGSPGTSGGGGGGGAAQDVLEHPLAAQNRRRAGRIRRNRQKAALAEQARARRTLVERDAPETVRRRHSGSRSAVPAVR